MELCESEKQYEAYFEATKNLQREFKTIPTKCKQDDWTITHFFEERNWTKPGFHYQIMFLGQDMRVRFYPIFKIISTFSDFICIGKS